jgi:uncharacterized protein (DUF2141 family)
MKMKNLHIVLAVFIVMLTAQSAEAQLMNTKLQITVTNDLGNLIEGATVTLFNSMDDYDSETNPVQSATTDEKGRVLFYELEPKSYFMTVTKDDLTNAGRGTQTSKLIAKKKNIINVVIE